MNTPDIHTMREVLPQIYAYSTPEIRRHDGWVKIGYTEQENVEERIAEQCHTADIAWKTEWHGNAVYEGSSETFHDTDFHAYLERLGVERLQNTEWFHISGKESKEDFRENRGVIGGGKQTTPYLLRDSQRDAALKTETFFRSGGKDFLWNAKPRFGKTLTVYDLCIRMKFKKVLVLTNRPAIATSWYDDYERFVGSGRFLFVSEAGELRSKKLCLSRQQYLRQLDAKNGVRNIIEFVSLQDLKGSLYFGGKYDKLREVAELGWDLLVVDEAHEGVDTYKSDVAFDQIHRDHTLYLSGTPFKALRDDKFPDGAIYNWTYADERKARKGWDETIGTNPYADMPQLNMYTYRMSDIVLDKAQSGIYLNGKTTEYAFDLNEFFKVEHGRFKYDAQVDQFLDALMTQPRFPFSTQKLRDELRHTFWLLDRVDSVKKLAEKLRDTIRHPQYKGYEIIIAAGDGKTDDDAIIEDDKAIRRVQKAILEHDHTITLSVGQLTTGVTISEWTGVFMLSNIKSPQLYMQTAFRAQNPYLYKGDDGKYHRKENAYIFDFDPARTLNLYERMANGLCSDTAADKGDNESRKRHIRELLNFFPVIGEDENGEMELLDAEKVLSIPRKIRSKEVVRRGFMSNFLFQNIGNIFSCPAAVAGILNKITSYGQSKIVDSSKAEDINVDENAVPDNKAVIGLQEGVFGQKIYKDAEEEFSHKIEDAISEMRANPDNAQTRLEKMLDAISKSLGDTLVSQATSYAKDNGHPLSKRTQGSLKVEAAKRLHNSTGKIVSENLIRLNFLDCKAKKDSEGKTTQEKASIMAEAEKKKLEIVDATLKQITKKKGEILSGCVETVSKAVLHQEVEDKKDGVENQVREHLRGFTRTIPSFLMAYGNSGTALKNFEEGIPEDVFLDVTSITKDEFRLLRDGGEVMYPETGKEEHFDGGLFNEVVFNDSIREFMSLRQSLANYFDPSLTKDIFDYIPAQKTNLIFTPKNVVKEMVDDMEKENPGCFDNPENTFADLYMKSGLFIAEIVKRLYRSEGLRQAFPDDSERLKHIFKHQVYGLAPTEIILRISKNFILGFDENFCLSEEDYNLRLADAVPSAKAGEMEKLIDSIFQRP